ncbi:hypothetical protein FRC10_000407 [Ceratobasidium sp. 414]|nr:hypothetical protein FRC10_000407 [Ceratobasidium sp. 414]
MRRAVLTPFPNIKDGLQWRFMAGFRWGKYDRDEAGEVFASVLDQVDAKVPEWIDQVENIWRDWCSRHTEKAFKWRRSPTDCVFKANKDHPLFGMLHGGSDPVVPMPLFYPDLLITRRDDEWNPKYFQACPDASRIAGGLLECLWMQDAANVELKVMGRQFVCGRCSDQKARDWSGIIRHYIEEQHRYKQARSRLPKSSSDNRHDLAEENKEPMV